MSTRTTPRGPAAPDGPGGIAGGHAAGEASARYDDESSAWVRALAAEGAGHADACERLHTALLRVARAELWRRRERHDLRGPELDDVAQQAADDALMGVIRKIGSFRGESRFTTWAYSFVVLEVSSALGRHFWRAPRVVLETEGWERLPDRLGIDPAQAAEASDLFAAVRHIVETGLTPHQRRVFTALVIRGVPLDALVVELGTNRNALYKTMFEARRRLRERLVAGGFVNGTVRKGR